MDTKVIALYFPQFHAIPENDKWWGEGFTDWNNVKTSYPLYEGHLQPRVPLNNNYYDLTDYNVLKWQAQLAKHYGIYGFAIYHYWFDGKQLLEKPKEMFLSHPEIDIPFCLTWANESWSRRWEGRDKETLMLQTHEPSKEQWKAHFDYLLPYFKDKRAIKIDGKILFQIYNPHLVNNVDEMISYWRELANENGIGELYFMAIKSFDFPNSAIIDSFDGVLLFQPRAASNSTNNKGALQVFLENSLRRLPESWVEKFRSIRTQSRKAHKVHSYQKICDIALKQGEEANNKDLFNMAFMRWDNTARYREKATIYEGCTPKTFENNFKKLYNAASKNTEGKKFVFINAWNEWAEGTYLEPDTDYGYEFLEAIKKISSQND